MSKLYAFVLVIFCFLAGLSGDYFSSVVFAKEDLSSNVKDRITARSLVIVDKQNKTRAGMGFDPDGHPIIFINDQNQKARMIMGCGINGPIIILTDSNEATSLYLRASDKGRSSIGLSNKKTKNTRLVLTYIPNQGPTIGLFDENNAGKALISVTNGNPSVTLLDKDKKPAIAMLTRKGEGSILGIWNSNNEPAVSLAVKGDKPGLFMYQQPRTGLLFNTAGGRPALALMNNGTPIWSATGDTPAAPEMPLSDDLLKELTR